MYSLIIMGEDLLELLPASGWKCRNLNSIAGERKFSRVISPVGGLYLLISSPVWTSNSLKKMS